MVTSRIIGVTSHLPERTETNEDLENLFPEWSASKIALKTGINKRHFAKDDEFTGDLAVAAASKLLLLFPEYAAIISHLILVTQTPDYILPGTSNFVHQELALGPDVLSMDVNLGCSGYVSALGIADALIKADQNSVVLLITADTYTKLLNRFDKTVRTIFGDGSTATLIAGDKTGRGFTGLKQGTDGASAGKLIVPNGGLRSKNPSIRVPEREFMPGQYDLFMDGPGIFNFTLEVVKPTVLRSLESAGLEAEDVDYYIFHQANAFMLSHLVEKLGLPKSKCPIAMSEWGNTVSSSIPMVLDVMIRENRLQRGMNVMLVGFGVGLAWSSIVLEF